MPVRSVAVDIGQNLTLACAEEDALPQAGESVGVMWIREGREDGQIERLKVEPNGALQLINVSADDAGNYSCTLDDDHDAVKTRINVQVKSKLLKFTYNFQAIAHQKIFYFYYIFSSSTSFTQCMGQTINNIGKYSLGSSWHRWLSYHRFHCRISS